MIRSLSRRKSRPIVRDGFAGHDNAVKTRLTKVGLSLVLAAAVVTPAFPAPFHAEVSVLVDVWPDKIWDYFRVFCSAPLMIGKESYCSVGHGGPGSIRVRGDGTEERMVSVGPFSYTYEIITGPEAEQGLRITLRVEPTDDPFKSMLIATLDWDEETIPQDERLAAEYRYPAIIRGELVAAKNLAEAS